VTKKEIHDETKHEIELEAEAELEEAGGAQPDDSAVEAEPSTADETPEEAIERLKAESDEYLDGWQRSRAEFANYKKRGLLVRSSHDTWGFSMIWSAPLPIRPPRTSVMSGLPACI
jgi:molecular chaperone GrpE (heat shock protein)